MNSSWISWYYFWVRVLETREITAVFLTASKTFNVGMHSDIYKSIWVRLDVMIDTIELYMLILVVVTLTSIQGRRNTVDLDGSWCTVETFWYDEPHTHFISSIQFSRGVGDTLLMWFREKTTTTTTYKQKTTLADIYTPTSFKLGMMIETTKLYISISVWMTLTLIQGHRWLGNDKNSWVHFFEHFVVDLGEIRYVATTCWFVEGLAKFIVHKKYSRETTLLVWFYEICV